jgi:pimeloyl-ACP methyl ester carboxylesterase
VPFGWITDQIRLGLRPEYYWNSLAAARAQVGPAGQRVVRADRLSELRVPTLIVWGERDRILPIQHAEEAVRRLPHGRLEINPECGHMPHVECPTLFVALLEGFLASVEGAELIGTSRAS